MSIYCLGKMIPRISRTAYIHEGADIIGKVTIGEMCYVGPSASIRGDFGTIYIGDGSVIQDSGTIHSRLGESTFLGPNSLIGHGATLHGCSIEGNAQVSMGATILDKVIMERHSMVAAGALVISGTTIKSGTWVAGVPAEVKGEMDREKLVVMESSLSYYHELIALYKNEFFKISAEDADCEYKKHLK